jgi:transglutaminase-like putative cysteine protease
VTGPTWALILVTAAAAGYAGQVGLRAFQHHVEQALLEYLFSIRSETDPFRSSTAIGSLGQLKLSDRIALRVTPHESIRIPLLLREASYNVYHGGTWYAVNGHFTAIQPEGDGETWKLVPGPPTGRTVTVSAYLKGGAGMLALPLGAFEIGHLAVVGVGVNRLGAVKVREGLGLVTYTAHTSHRAGLDAPPDAGDVRLPAREGRVVPQIVDELGLRSMSPARAVITTRAYFAREFRYSSWGRERRPPAEALEDFLLRRRAGHCEYFATASTLLLRAAGIPARYAVGYSVHEWSRLEDAYVARDRHAHSWTLAWVEGLWMDVDTTPPAWVDEERSGAAWEWLDDLWSWTVFQFSRWRWSDGSTSPVRYLAWLLAPLVLVLVWRIASRTRLGRRTAARVAAARGVHAGADSEFYLIERRLAEAGLGRGRSEPAAVWARRLKRADGLEEIVALHDRYRFDPRGLATEERRALTEKATAWLFAQSRQSAGSSRG